MIRSVSIAHFDRATWQNLLYVALFVGFCLLRNVCAPPSVEISGASLPWSIIALDLIIFGVVVGYVIMTIRRRAFSSAQWGLQLRAVDWLYIAVIGAGGIYFVSFADRFSASSFVGGLSIVLAIMTYELVFRAALMNVLIQKWGDSTRAVLCAVFVSGLVYSLALMPLTSYSELTVGAMLVLSYLFHHVRSIVLFVFLIAAYAVPSEYGFGVALSTIVIYLALVWISSRIGLNK